VEVALVDDEQRSRAAALDSGQVATYASVVDEPPFVFAVPVAERADDPDDVDVRRDDL